MVSCRNCEGCPVCGGENPGRAEKAEAMVEALKAALLRAHHVVCDVAMYWEGRPIVTTEHEAKVLDGDITGLLGPLEV